MQRFQRIALSALFVVSLPLPAADLSPAAQRRAADRQSRASALKNYPDMLRKAQSQYLTALAGTCQWLITQKAKDEATALTQEIEKIDEKNSGLPALKKNLEVLATDTPLDEAAKKELATRRKNAQKTRAGGMADLAKSLYSGGLPRQAYDLIQQALEFDPDHAPARMALGQTKVADKWLDAWAASQAQKGNTFVPDYGWVPTTAVERTKKDEWFENGKWLGLADADTLHSTLATAWVIESSHFIIKSTAPRKRAVALSERLEGFYQCCYREYLEFFMRGEKKPQMSFTHAAAKKFLVHQFGTHKDYETTLKKDLKNPLIQAFIPFLTILPGFYTPFSHASYFEVGDDNAFQQIFTLNMVGRQILCEFSQGGNPAPKPWIVGGSVEMLEFAKIGDDGKWYVPAGHPHPSVLAAEELFNNGNFPPLPVLLALEEKEYNKEPGNKENNTVSGAFCRFLLDMKEGAYALDFLEFAFDAMKNPKTAVFADYIGIEMPELDKSFREFLINKK